MNRCNKSLVAFRILCLVVISGFVLGGCVSGGRLSPPGPPDHQVLALYRPESDTPKADYYLIQTKTGLGLLEKPAKGRDALATTHWRTHAGDHFAIWIGFLSRQGGAFEFVIPLDRTQPGKRFYYPPETYSLIQMDGIERPVPINRANHPPLKLIPVGLAKPVSNPEGWPEDWPTRQTPMLTSKHTEPIRPHTTSA
jgi:hypothetical protein